MAKGKSFDRPVAVAVEGIDFMHLLRLQFDCDRTDKDFWLYDFFEQRDLEVRQGGAFTRWLNNFQTLASEAHDFAVGTLAVIRDAEDNSESEFNSICDILRNAGMPTPNANGAFAEGQWKSKPFRTGVLIVPKDLSSGCLETCLLEAPKQSFALKPARKFQQAAEQAARAEDALRAKLEAKTLGGLARWREKVVVRAMIAASPDDPGQTLSASGKWLWDFNREPLKGIIQFINDARVANT